MPPVFYAVLKYVIVFLLEKRNSTQSGSYNTGTRWCAVRTFWRLVCSRGQDERVEDADKKWPKRNV